MTFFQNSNSIQALIPPLSTVGFDSLGSVVTSWSDFLDNSVHTDRRQAFREFVYLMFYYRNRRLSGAKFPHNLLFEKVLKFYVETIPNPTGIPIPCTVKLGNPNEKLAIFQEVTAGSDVYSPSVTSISQQTPILRGEQTALNNPREIPNIDLEVSIALATGNTTIGFIQETATLFAHFYLTRQLIIFNGHEFNFTQPPIPNNSMAVSNVIRRYREDDEYYINTGNQLSGRTQRMMTHVNKQKSMLPYFYNSLINILSQLGFQIPETPLSLSSPSLPSYVQIDHQKIFLAYFIKLLDPIRPVGIYKNAAGHRFVDLNFSCKAELPISTSRNAIMNVPPNYSSQTNEPSQNTFIEDLWITIISVNFGGVDLAGAGGTTTGYENIQKRPFFINGTNLTFSDPPTTDEVLEIIQKTFEAIADTTNRAILEESRAMVGYFLNRSDIDSKNTILASGVGETSVSILGIRNFGLPFYNYKMASNTEISRTKSVVKTISLKKREAVHIGTYALDLFSAPPSSLTIKVDNSIEVYKFSLIPENSSLTGDMKIIPIQIPYSVGVDFYSVENSLTGITSYYRKLKRNVSGTGTSTHELIAEYNLNTRDLTFRKFTDYEINEVYNLSNTYPSSPSRSAQFEVRSAVSSNNITEELLTLISVFEDKSPGVISDDVLYESETFQLFGSFASGLNLNSKSYSRLLESSNEQLGVQLIFDLINNSNYAVNFLPPILKGSFVGMIPIAGSGIGTRSSKVVPDTGYGPKFAGLDETIGIPNGKEAVYEALKFSWGRIILSQSPAYPAIPNTIDVELEIVSFVNPSKSELNLHVNPTEEQLIKDKVESTTPNASYNQPLAMLRSFGLLEGLVEKMKVLASSHPASVSILNKLDNWMPPVGSIDADTIICVDENISGSIIRANDISLSDYYKLKRL